MDFCLCCAILNMKAFCFRAIPDIMIELIVYGSVSQSRQAYRVCLLQGPPSKVPHNLTSTGLICPKSDTSCWQRILIYPTPTVSCVSLALEPIVGSVFLYTRYLLSLVSALHQSQLLVVYSYIPDTYCLLCQPLIQSLALEPIIGSVFLYQDGQRTSYIRVFFFIENFIMAEIFQPSEKIKLIFMLF